MHASVAVLFFLLILGVANVYDAAEALGDYSYQAVKTEGSPTVYLLSQSLYKMPVPTMAAFKSYGLSIADIQTVPQELLDLYSDPQFVMQGGTQNVYQLKDGQKKYLSPSIKQLVGPKGIFIVTATHARAIRTAKAVTLAEAQTLSARQVAAATTDPDIPQCQPDPQVGGEDGCLIYQSIQEKNPEVCWGAKDEKWQMSCWLSQDPPDSDPLLYCKNVSANFKDDCVLGVATRKKDLLLCQQISSQEKQKQCSAFVGINSGDANSCQLLPDNDSDISRPSKNFCLYSFAMINSQPEVCAQIPAASPYYASCQKFSSALNAGPAQ